MFDIGGPELVVILLVALLVLGPKRIPGFARLLSRLAREARKALDEITRDLHDGGGYGG